MMRAVANIYTLLYICYTVIQYGISGGLLLQSAMLHLLFAYVNRYYCNNTSVTYLNVFLGIQYLLTIGVVLILGAKMADNKDLSKDLKVVMSKGILIGLFLITIPIVLVYLNNKVCTA